MSGESIHQRSLLFCNFSNVYGGQETWLESLAKELTCRYDLRIDFLGSPEKLLASPAFFRAVAVAPGLLQFRSASRAAAELKNTYAAVLLNGNRALYKNMLHDLSIGCPKVYVQHSMLEDGQKSIWRRSLRRILFSVGLHRVDASVGVSRASFPTRFSPINHCVIHNGVGTSEHGQPKYTSSGEVQIALMVGALNENKNQECAIRALELLPNTRLILAGGGSLTTHLKAIAAHLGLSDRVEFRGFVEDVSALYREADVFMCLSRFEGLPMALLEAMAAGLPVVATRAGGIPEAVRQRREGLLLSVPTTPYEVAAALHTLRRSPGLAATLGSNAKRRVGEEFNIEAMTQEYWTLFRRLEDAARCDRQRAG